jgi:hypothetical protein
MDRADHDPCRCRGLDLDHGRCHGHDHGRGHCHGRCCDYGCDHGHDRESQNQNICALELLWIKFARAMYR